MTEARRYADMVIYRFCIQVADDGMSDDHILNGDTVIIEKRSSITSRDIAAIVRDSEIILRRVERQGKNHLLIPSNPRMIPELRSDVVIIGKVIKTVIDV